MYIRVYIADRGKDTKEEIGLLEYELDGRPGGREVDSDMKPLDIYEFTVIKEGDPLVIEFKCEKCNIDEYIGGYDHISYDVIW